MFLWVPRWPALVAGAALVLVAICVEGATVGYVYVNAEGAVVGYAVDGGGALTLVPGSPYATVPSMSNCAVMTAIFDQTRDVLYVSNPVSSGAGTVSAFAVNRATGVLTSVPGSPFAMTPGGTGAFPAGLAIDGTHSFLYAGKGYSFGTGPYGVDGFRIAANGALALLAGSPFGVGGTMSGFVLLNDPVENTLISGDNDTDLTVFRVDGLGGLTPIVGSPFTSPGANIHSLTLNPTRRELAVGSNWTSEARVFQILPGGGLPASYAVGTPANTGMAYTPAGNRLYSTTWGKTLTGFEVAPGPVVSPSAWVSVQVGFTAVNAAMSPDGGLLFVTGYGKLKSFTLNPGDGFPTAVASVSFATGGGCASGIAFVPVVTASPAMTVTKMQIPAGGALAAGTAVTYRIVVGNSGTVTAAAVSVSDTVSAVLVGQAAYAPAVFGAPVITPLAIGSGTLYAWAASGLAFGPGQSFTFTITGTAGPVCAPAAVMNTAYVTMTTASGTVTAYTNTTQFQATPGALTCVVARAQSPASPGVGSAVTYRIDLTNTSGITITDLSLTDTLPSVLAGAVTDQPVLAGPPASADVGSGTRYVWSASGVQFPPGACWSFTVSGELGPVCAPVSLSGTAFVTAAGGCSTVTAYSNPAGSVLAPPSFSCTVSVLQAPAAAGVGEAVGWRIVLANAGEATITAVSVVDTLPGGIVGNLSSDQPGAFAPAAVASLPGGGTRFIWSASGLALPPGGSFTFSVSGAVGLTCVSRTLSATVMILAATDCASTAFSLVTDAPPFQPPAFGWSVSLTRLPAGSILPPGSAVTYRLVVANTGAVTLSDLTIVETTAAVYATQTDAAPALLGSAAVTGLADGGTRYVWSASGLSIQPGDVLTFTITGILGLSCEPGIAHAVGVQAGWACGTTAWAGTTPPFALPPLAYAVTALQEPPVASSLRSGDPLTWRLVLSNTGGATIIGVEAVETIPAGVALQGTDQPSGFGPPVAAGVAGGTRYVWSAAGLQLLPGGVYTFTVTGAAGLACADGVLSATGLVTAVADCGAGSPLAANPVGSFYVAAVAVLNVRATQSPPPGPILPVGAPVTYRIDVANAGTATLTRVDVTDTIPGVLVGVTGAGPPAFGVPTVASVPGGTRFVWSLAVPAMRPGDSWSFTIAGQVGALCGAGFAVNQALVVGTGECPGATLMVTNATTFNYVGPVLDVNASVVLTTAPPGVGDPLTYRIVVANAGEATIDVVVLTDTLPSFIVSAAVAAPPAFGAALVTSVPGGTRYEWSAAGLGLRPGASLTITVAGALAESCAAVSFADAAVVAVGAACGSKTVTASASAWSAPPHVASLALAQRRDPPAPQPGEPVTYMIVLTNDGSATLDALTLVETVPPGTSAVAESNTGGWAYAAAGVVHAWSFGGPLPPGRSVTFALDAVAGCYSGPTGTGAAASSLGPCGPAAAADAASFTIAGPQLAVTATKSPSAVRLLPGQPIMFVVKVTNTGGATIESLLLTDTLPAAVLPGGVTGPPGFTLTATAVPGGAGVRYAWSRTGMGMTPGTSYVFTVTGTAAEAGTPVTVRQPASVAAVSGCSALTALTNDSVLLVTPPASGQLETTLTMSTNPALVGGSVQIVCVVRNGGRGSLSGVRPVLSLGEGASLLGPLNGPTPPPPVDLPAGASAAFTWSAGAIGLGTVAVHVQVAAVSADTGAAASAAADARTAVDPLGGPQADAGWVYIIGGRDGAVAPLAGESAVIVVRSPRAGPIEIRILAMDGVEVRAFAGRAAGGDRQEFPWDGRNASGQPVPPGPYAVVVRAPSARFLGKCLVRR